MAKKGKFNGTRYKHKKGEVIAGPTVAYKGPVRSEIKRFTQKEIVRIVEVMFSTNRFQLRAIAECGETPGIDAWVARIVERGIAKGDYKPLEALLNRILGKPKEYVELTGPDGGPLNIKSSFMQMTPEERKEELARIRAEKAALGED